MTRMVWCRRFYCSMLFNEDDRYCPHHPWWQRVVMRFQPRQRHVCSDFLPDAATLPEGSLATCMGCGRECRRYDYDDDDLYGGTATYLGWTSA